MADHSVVPPPRIREGRATPDAASRASRDTGNSSSPRSRRPHRVHGRHVVDGPSASDDGPRGWRRASNLSSGSFLLRDSLGADRHLPARRRLARDAAHSDPRASTAPRTPESTRSAADPDDGMVASSDTSSRWATTPPRPRAKASPDPDRVPPGTVQGQSSPRQDPSNFDVDSAHIVTMALTLSESRRMASQRSFSRRTPPRLAPVPDSGATGTLRHHLQQQRCSSQDASPRSRLASSSRVPSGIRLSGPPLSVLDTASDGQYRYHFSSSTLSRTQRAKEHLELMAEYRRLLESLPPLNPTAQRLVPASPSTSPAGSKQTNSAPRNNVALRAGRHYNPLQYIRNRKVRARERKVIDAERQGFGDVESVRSWVNKVCERSSSLNGPSGNDDEPTLPPFPGADGPQSPSSSEAAASRAAARTRRPRVDWLVEPCDLVADAYWLEQRHHKHLIEDRHWRKIFPTPADLSRPTSRNSGSPDHVATPQSRPTEGLPESSVVEDLDLSNNSTRDRARQRLQKIKTFPHRHGNSLHSHHHLHRRDLRRLGRDLASDLSASENDSKDHARRDMRHVTPSNSINDLLEKQMMEMVAEEAHERALAGGDADGGRISYPALLSPESPNPLSPPSSQSLSRRASMADTSDSDPKSGPDKPSTWPHRPQPGKSAADWAYLPSNRSTEKVSAAASSPELPPHGANTTEQVTLSPPLSPTWSRSGSPTRNPLSKLRNMIRDKSGDTTDGAPPTEADDSSRPVLAHDPKPPPEKTVVPRRRTLSPTKKLNFERPPEGWRSHRRSGSLLQRLDEQGAGLRGMLKGPRLDTVIRGSVSRLGDILWKKEEPGEASPEMNSTDESECEKTRGRHKASSPLPKGQSTAKPDESRPVSKHFLDVMPDFNHAPGFRLHNAGGGAAREAASGAASPSGPPSRLQLPKSPPTGSRNASPSVPRRVGAGDPEAWETDSGQGSIADGARGREKRPDKAEMVSSDASIQRQSRHWSMADLGGQAGKTRLSRREIARMRALMLSSGIKAMEISRRANEICEPFNNEASTVGPSSLPARRAGIEWADIAQLSPDGQRLGRHKAAFCELYPLAARTLSGAIQASGQRWKASTDRLTGPTRAELQRRVGLARSRLVDDLSEMARRAAGDADETSRDLALGQPLKVKHVTDAMDKMLRRRRRRLRWLRRALWLTVEWLLVGLMWYVWFVVMILRAVLGLGKGLWRGARWLLWV